jgi:hypothetical protein
VSCTVHALLLEKSKKPGVSKTKVILGFCFSTILANFLNAISLPAPGGLPITTVTGFVGSQAKASAGINNNIANI